MDRRIAVVVGILSCLAFAIGASPLTAEPGIPSDEDIVKALRPVPKVLSVHHQGIPTLSTLPSPVESSSVHSVSLRSDETAATPNPPKGRARDGGTVRTPRTNNEPRPAMTFNTVQFTFGSAQLTPESIETLRNLGNALNQGLADQKAFLIEGHTDAVGGHRANADLSQRRAEAVKDYLIRQAGVSPSRLRTLGKGSSEPANRSDPYAAENRRVIVINIGA